MIKAYIDGLKKWKRWDGRTRRRDYWLYSACNYLVLAIAYSLSILLSTFGFTTLAIFSWIATVAYSVLQFMPTLAITIRRLHDTGRGFFHLLIQFLPAVISGILSVIGIGGILNSIISSACEIIFFVWMVLPGTKGRNKFGPDPKDVQFSQDDATNYGDYPDFRGE